MSLARTRTLAATGALACLALVGCSAIGGNAVGPLQPLPMNGAGADVENVQTSNTWAVEYLLACVTSAPQSFSIQEISLIGATGEPEVLPGAYFGTEKPEFVKPGKLSSIYLDPKEIRAGDIRKTGCPSQKEFLAVGVQVRSDEFWSIEGVRLKYSADGHDYEITWDVHIKVCSPKQAREATCPLGKPPTPTG